MSWLGPRGTVCRRAPAGRPGNANRGGPRLGIRCVVISLRDQDEAKYALNIRLHEGHPRTSLLK